MASQSVKHVLVMTVLVVSDRNPNQMSLCKNKRESKSSCHSKVSGQGKLQEQLDPVTQLLSLGLILCLCHSAVQMDLSLSEAAAV